MSANEGPTPRRVAFLLRLGHEELKAQRRAGNDVPPAPEDAAIAFFCEDE